jgi:hypothetical protein
MGTKKRPYGAGNAVGAVQKGNLLMRNIIILRLSRKLVKLAITADLVLLLAALGSLNVPTTIAALLALNLLCGLYFKEESRHEEI